MDKYCRLEQSATNTDCSSQCRPLIQLVCTVSSELPDYRCIFSSTHAMSGHSHALFSVAEFDQHALGARGCQSGRSVIRQLAGARVRAENISELGLTVGYVLQQFCFMSVRQAEVEV
jgi:hypothetical protein